MTDAALAGLRVLDLSVDVAGSYCAKLFGDYGADVIKIEPFDGDPVRRVGPFAGDQPHPEKSGLFTFLNVNKRSVVLDIGQPRGATLAKRLIASVDVVVESYEPGYLDSLGLGFDALESVKPGLVMTSVTPYGQTGPWRGRAGNDLTANAVGLWAAVNGVKGESPLAEPGYNASFVGGLAGYIAAMAAVWYRDQHGVGQQVDVSIAEAIAALAGPTFHRTQVIGEPVRLPSSDGPAALFEAKDGYINVSLGLNRFMDQVWLELGLDEPQAAAAVWHQGRPRELRPQMALAIAEREKFELFMKLVEIQGPAAVAMTTQDLYNDPHLRQRGFWHTVDQPGMGSIDIPGPSFQMEQTPFAVRRAAPRLGEHTSDVLQEQLGLGAEELKTLYINCVIGEGVMGPEAGLQR